MAVPAAFGIGDALGGAAGVGRRAIHAGPDLVDIVRDGLPHAAFESIRKLLGLSVESISAALGLAPRTLARRKKQQRLTSEESDRVIRFARLAAAAIELFGNPEKASKWLQQPNRALGGVTPLSLMDTAAGVKAVVPPRSVVCTYDILSDLLEIVALAPFLHICVAHPGREWGETIGRPRDTLSLCEAYRNAVGTPASSTRRDCPPLCGCAHSRPPARGSRGRSKRRGRRASPGLAEVLDESVFASLLTGAPVVDDPGGNEACGLVASSPGFSVRRTGANTLRGERPRR